MLYLRRDKHKDMLCDPVLDVSDLVRAGQENSQVVCFQEPDEGLGDGLLGWKRRKMVIHNPRSCASATSNAMATCSDLRAHPWGPQGRRRRWGKSGRNQGDGNACFATIMYIVGLNKNWRCLYLHLPVEFCPHPQLFLASRFLPCTLSSPCWTSSFPPSVCIFLSDLSKGKIYHMYHRFKIF